MTQESVRRAAIDARIGGRPGRLSPGRSRLSAGCSTGLPRRRSPGSRYGAVLFLFVFAPELPDTDALVSDRPSPGLTVIGADGDKLVHRGSFNGLSIRLAKAAGAPVRKR